jgi:hypothetical protein
LARGETRQGLRRLPHRQAIRYALKHWAGLTVVLDDGRVEIDSNVVERSIRLIALNRKKAHPAPDS